MLKATGRVFINDVLLILLPTGLSDYIGRIIRSRENVSRSAFILGDNNEF